VSLAGQQLAKGLHGCLGIGMIVAKSAASNGESLPGQGFGLRVKEGQPSSVARSRKGSGLIGRFESIVTVKMA
jgi:hypothetical protein